MPADLANYHWIPATGPLENLYHRSEAATGIDRYNRNSLTEQQSALKRFRWSRDEPQFGLRRRAGRGGKKRSREESRVAEPTSLSTLSRLTEWTARDVRARERDETRGEGKVKERKGKEGAQGKGTSESFACDSAQSDPSQATALIPAVPRSLSPRLDPLLFLSRHTPTVHKHARTPCSLIHTGGVIDHRSRLPSSASVLAAARSVQVATSSRRVRPDRRKSPPDMSQCTYQHRADRYTRVQWATTVPSLLLHSFFFTVSSLVRVFFFFGFSVINSSLHKKLLHCELSWLVRARFVDNFYGSSQVDPRHTGSVMTLPTRRAAASINTAATACLRSGIWVFRGQGAYHWTFSLSLFYLTLSSVFYSIRFDCSLLSTAFVFSTRRSVDTKQPRYLNGSFVRFNLIPFIRAVFCSLFIIEEENGRSFLLNVIVFLPSRCVRVPSLCLIEESDRGPATGKYLSWV